MMAMLRCCLLLPSSGISSNKQQLVAVDLLDATHKSINLLQSLYVKKNQKTHYNKKYLWQKNMRRFDV
jgi:hypothetical protein